MEGLDQRGDLARGARRHARQLGLGAADHGLQRHQPRLRHAMVTHTQDGSSLLLHALWVLAGVCMMSGSWHSSLTTSKAGMPQMRLHHAVKRDKHSNGASTSVMLWSHLSKAQAGQAQPSRVAKAHVVQQGSTWDSSAVRRPASAPILLRIALRSSCSKHSYSGLANLPQPSAHLYTV